MPPRFKDWASRLAGIKAGEDANQIENSLYDAYGPRWAAKRGRKGTLKEEPLHGLVAGD